MNYLEERIIHHPKTYIMGSKAEISFFAVEEKIFIETTNFFDNISLNKDYSNIDEVLERFADRDYVRRMVEDTYEYVLGNHTHHHRVADIWRDVS